MKQQGRRFTHSPIIKTYLSWVSEVVFLVRVKSSRSSDTEKCRWTSSSQSTTQLLRAFLCACRWNIFSSILPVLNEKIRINMLFGIQKDFFITWPWEGHCRYANWATRKVKSLQRMEKHFQHVVGDREVICSNRERSKI